MDAAIERLIAVLDALDAPGEDREDTGETEAEPDAEPSLGWPEQVDQRDLGATHEPDVEFDPTDCIAHERRGGTDWSKPHCRAAINDLSEFLFRTGRIAR